MRFLAVVLAVVVLCGAFRFAQSSPPRSANPPAAVPEWIWLSQAARDHETVFFRKTFTVKGRVKSALLAATCDNHVTLFLNGKQVLRHDTWEEPAHAEVTGSLRQGLNVLAARCQNDGGPAGFLLRLSVELAGGGKQTIVTDASWLASAHPVKSWNRPNLDTAGWKSAHSFGRLGVAPWHHVHLEGGPAATATRADVIRTLPDFKVELLYSVPRAVQGSWVSMTADPRGRLIVSDQYGSLYRVTPGQDAAHTRVEKLNVPIGEAQGLLYAYDSLYVTVNSDHGRSGLYRLRDTRGTDQFDEVTLLKKLDGAGEHGPHGLRLGPDGLLYLIAGNFTRVPAGIDPHSPHRNYAEDQLLPRNPDGNGFATGIMAPGGWVARTDKDGRHWELFCGGFRNPYDIDFNPDGELFTYDADMEWDLGTPWYRPTRVNHVVSGAEYGWRYGTGKWPAYYPDSVGAVVDIGLGSPTGIQFGTGAKFPAKYQRALFLNDWTYGKIYAVHLQPRGASYTASFEVFLQGKPLPVTDVVVNKDGALYFTTGGRRMQSGLYRVTYTGAESTAPASPLVDEAAARARALRHKLETFQTRSTPEAVSAAWPYLNSPDRALRYAARVAIEHQPLQQWRDRALAETRSTARIQALLALTRGGGKDLQGPVLARLNQLPFARLSEEQMLDALRVYALAFIRLGGKSPASAQEVRARLSPLFPAQSVWVNRELCKVLVYLDDPGVIGPAMKLVQSAHTQEEQMFYIFVLRNLRTGWTLDQRKAYFSWLNLAEAKYHGGASFKKFVQRIRQDAVDTLSDQEKVALKDVLQGRESVAAVQQETTRQFVHNWQMADLEPLLGQAEKGRSFEKGRQAFEAAQCSKCHRFGGEGGDTGPDLTGVGNRFDARYVLESILEPSRVISDQYAGVVIETKDGRLITGRVINEDAKRLQVRTDPFARELTEVRKANIESRTPSTISEMPQGLVNVLTRDEVLDLIAYLRSGGDPTDRAFVKK